MIFQLKARHHNQWFLKQDLTCLKNQSNYADADLFRKVHKFRKILLPYRVFFQRCQFYLRNSGQVYLFARVLCIQSAVHHDAAANQGLFQKIQNTPVLRFSPF